MNYDLWKIFLDAVELGSLSKVATLHNSNQPQISRQMNELETQCGGRLFNRTGRGVELTDLGQHLLPKIRSWLNVTEQLNNEILHSTDTPIGTVRIASLPSTAHPLLTTLYQVLKQKYPLIKLSVREGQGVHLEKWLEDGSVDLAILYRFNPTPKQGDIYLTEADTYLVGCHADALTQSKEIHFKEITHLPLVTFCRPSNWRNFLDHMAYEHGLELNIVFEADSISLQTHLVSTSGIYTMLGPQALMKASQYTPIQASKIISPELKRYISLSLSKHGYLTPACKAVMDEIKLLSYLL
ncbi:LysR family transcriptional regulator [Acinetobacter guerrae]|uniref:LysR family transcriptional regulator n=1 Tax=Acinetobacter guerrae TaxID=1843371 RepID=A0A3A8EYF3_9GAMM|nr:LysR family transcriptional regulator [Acinetobacter guerrae]RKG33881.1 LysR family transcriptional regulator [Acinetobacter guerrae]